MRINIPLAAVREGATTVAVHAGRMPYDSEQFCHIQAHKSYIRQADRGDDETLSLSKSSTSKVIEISLKFHCECHANSAKHGLRHRGGANSMLNLLHYSTFITLHISVLPDRRSKWY
jgi:hypothetical protein